MSNDDIPLFQVDKEAMVINLYKQRKSRREIASVARVNFSTIKNIIDREFGPQEEKKKGQSKEQSVYSKALQLFLSGKKPVDVSIKLGMGYEDVRRTYLQFLSLNRMQKLRKVFDDLGEEGIKSLLSLHFKMQQNDLTFEQIQKSIYYTDSLAELEQRHFALEAEVSELGSKRDNLVSVNRNVESLINVADRNLQCYNYETEMKKEELVQVSQEVNARKNFVQNFDNEEGVIRIKKAARQEIELVMQNNQALLVITIYALFETLREYPASQDLVLQLIMPDSTNPYQQFSIDMHKNELLELANQLQSEMIEQIISRTINTLENTVPE